MSCDTNLSYRESKALAFKLRREDPQQFQTLVRMHLSFILELVETEGSSTKSKFRPLKWGRVHFSKKLKAPERESSDSAPLTTDVCSQINNLVEFLSKEENIAQEGIFRRSGKVTRQQDLKSSLRQGNCPDLSSGQFSVHDVATVLKGFLADLPEPLLTDAYYPVYCHVAEMFKNDSGGKARILRALQLLFLLLPIENRKVLKRILELLHTTASHSSTNRMPAQNLATLFTPHLLCPRKLSPEIFHRTAQSLSCIVVFIINHAKEVFEIPPALATDIKVYWDRRQRTPDHLLERSMSESTAASTVFSFVDREMSVAENNPTETALAQLYAHIQGLPESNKKKRLIKQFNKENGQGTPRTKSIGISIKKHIFCKNAKAKGYFEFGNTKTSESSSDELLNSPPNKKTPMRPNLKRTKEEEKKEGGPRSGVAGMKRLPTDLESESEESPPKVAREETPTEEERRSSGLEQHQLGKERRRSCYWSPLGRGVSRLASSTPSAATLSAAASYPSTPTAAVAPPPPGTPLFQTPSSSAAAAAMTAQDDMSPITMSAQRMPRAMQEAMITPRSRKPVVALSGSNICQLGSREWTLKELSWSDGELKKEKRRGEAMSSSEEEDEEMEEEDVESLTSPFKDYLFSRSVLTTSPADLSFSSQPGDFTGGDHSTASHTSSPPSNTSTPPQQSLRQHRRLIDLHRDGLEIDAVPQDGLSDSLLYFLDGGGGSGGDCDLPSPRVLTPSGGAPHRLPVSDTPPVTETAL